MSRLISEVLNGEEIIIRRGKYPIVKLVKIQEKGKQRKFEMIKGKINSDFFSSLEEFEDYL